ncbi:MAG TPA: hypothetical protein DD979_13155 [Gammaproteobacteria bacterium]|nr:hypothetical protein [Gammaproteobacteria bacterium]
MRMSKQYGIRVKMPEGDPLSMSHLLGDQWESFRWYPTPQERDRMFEQMRQTPRNYRLGDNPSVVLEKVDR